MRFTVWRDGEERALEAPARRIARYDRNRNRYGVAPDYVVYAGLVFMRLEVELLKTLGRAGRRPPTATSSGTSSSARPSGPRRPIAR